MIVEHCTSEEQRFVLWRDHWKPFSQSKSFFFTDADHDDLNTMLKKVDAVEVTAPQGVAF